MGGQDKALFLGINLGCGPIPQKRIGRRSPQANEKSKRLRRSTATLERAGTHARMTRAESGARHRATERPSDRGARKAAHTTQPRASEGARERGSEGARERWGLI